MAEKPTKAKATKAAKSNKKKIRKSVPKANIYITASYNNTLMTATDLEGQVIGWATAGGNGFKGTRKSTPYAATVTAEKLVEKVTPYGVKNINVYVKGVGVGREQAIRGLQAAGLELDAIFDVTPAPHNGCRQRKSRRV